MERLASVPQAFKDRSGFFEVFILQADSDAGLLGEIGMILLLVHLIKKIFE
jgi:hypothetical protein